MSLPVRVRIRSSATIALALLIATAGGCEPPPPTEEFLIRHRWVAGADRDIMKYVCPEAQQLALEAEDPLRAATVFVQRGKELLRWREPIHWATETPPNLSAPLDSLRTAIGGIAMSFDAARVTAFSHHRECYGEFALNCTKDIRARDVLSRIDTATLHRARMDYFRHRTALAKSFDSAGVPLSTLKTC